ncbi:MAG: phosphatidylserine decarboxylase family protein [Deltaproteobacteria bacterium]|nr:phosphatidylserine decarboxylase family protein [Deltaproteobacteria bacterium]
MDKYIWADPAQGSAFPVARPGYPIIAASAFVTLILALIGLKCLTLSALFVTGFICAFFRDPDRVTPDIENAVICPADGRVVSASVVKENPFVTGPCMKVGIFMNVFNVHVNRIPVNGVIESITYRPGRFLPADKTEASTKNEHNAIVIKMEDGTRVGVVQIAGLVARRIICRKAESDSVAAGSRFGMICFGSRVDLYLPPDTRITVSAGEKVKAGSTIIGYLKKEDVSA